MKLGKFFSLLVSVALICSSLPTMMLFTSATTTSSYYVLSGADGDGKTEANPAPTVYDVINSINADGLVAGDTANIYIMQNSNWNDAVGSLVGVGSIPAHKITAWAENGGAVPEHTAKIVVQSYGTATNNYLAFTGYLGKNAPLVISGPTEFKNIRLVSTREFRAGINFNGNDLILGEGTTYGYINNNEYASTPVAWNGKVNTDSGAFIETTISTKNGGTYDSPMNVVIESPYCQYGYSDGKILHMGAINNATTTFNEDVNLTYNHSNTQAIFEWGSSGGNASATTIFNKNINLKIDNAKTYDNTKTNSPVTINGGYQVIKKSTLAVKHSIESLSNVTIEGGYWVINNDFASDAINFTATKGVFNVKPGYTVTITDNTDNTKLQSVNGLLTLPEGSYTIESVKRSRNDYYVISGGIGDGRTEDNPAPTVYDVINSINEDGLVVGDTANIYIMQNSNWNDAVGSLVGVGSVPAHKITAWAENGGAVPEHTAKIVVQSYGTVTNNYLAFTGYLGKNAPLVISGPTEFKNIRLVSTRSVISGLYFSGKNVTLGMGTTYGYIDNDQYKDESCWDGTVHTDNCGFDETSLTDADGGVFEEKINITVASEFGKYGKPIYMGAKKQGNTTFNEDINIIYDYKHSGANFVWGNKETAGNITFNGNVNIKLNDTKSLVNTESTSSVVFNGAYQLIKDSKIKINSDITKMSNITLAGGYFVLDNQTKYNDLLEFTNTKGVFCVKDGVNIVAINKSTGTAYVSYNNTITITENGQYTVTINGDATGDSVIDIKDLVRAKKAIANLATLENGVCDFDGNGYVAANDLSVMVQLLLKNGTFFFNEQLVSGSKSQADLLRSKIVNADNNITASQTGTTYYISNNGDDSADGKSSANAWKTLDKLQTTQLNAEDVVLFERGSLFRMTNSINLLSDVNYGAYGSGSKPTFYGSEYNYANPVFWSGGENDNIWELTMSSSSLIGNIVFDNGKCVGFLKDEKSQLTADRDYYFDSSAKKLYLYLSYGNPGDKFKDIEVCVANSGFVGLASLQNVCIDNLCIKYVGDSAIGFKWNVSNIDITNCEISYMGGVLNYSNKAGKIVRGGNGIGFWNTCSNINIENNWIYQGYDAGISPQGNSEDMLCKNFSSKQNLIEYCTWSYEMWSTSESSESVRFDNVDITNNIMRLAGYGWSATQRPDPEYTSHFNGFSHAVDNGFINCTLTGNIFDCSAYALVAWQWNEENINHDGFTISGNTYYQHSNDNNLAMWYGYAETLYGSREFATTQEQLEAAIAKFDNHPIIVEWLG